MTDRVDRLLEVWNSTIDAQKHFNELEMRVRSVAITVLAAFLAAAGYTLKERLYLHLFGCDLSLTVLVFLAAALCWSSFYFMDRFWYHRLRKGAVDHAQKIEKTLETELPEIGLTSSIGAASPITVGGKKLGSNQKMDWFYGSIFALLLLGALGSFLNHPRDQRPSAAPNRNAARPLP